ncbi:VOC family protein [Pseudonocardia petroleophila]|uniref:VOC family protein n=1 Tax=Pseudonocardia petroleophila TaxID=37331 RepID=A0A7G7MH21_9PSEU|nr:VOC family protein [Pseudonocardia petroleophila]QNG52082.1 VOC family protein [Pseudonocardia petroleophila]
MTAQFHPHLYFETECRAAMTRYQAVFGGDLQLNTFGEIGMEGDPDKVLGASLRTPDGLVLTAGDVTPGSSAGTGGSISITGDEATLRGWFDALAEGGEVHMPLEKQIWGEVFGQCVDRFGITWLINAETGRS